MTIHWNGLEEHFLMVPLIFLIQPFLGKNAFSEFFSLIRTSILKELNQLINDVIMLLLIIHRFV
jgi:hypothetical protein